MEQLEFEITADSSGLREALGDLERMSQRFGNAFGTALKSAAVDARQFDDVLRDLALRMSTIALDAAVEPLERGVSSVLGGLANSVAGALVGNSSAPVSGVPFSTRGPSSPFATRSAPGPVTLNVTTPDAASFRRSEGQIAALLARTAMRGRRSL